ncbi:MAG: sigma-70 family RNA polymerase sigma factor [Chloroflexota bacterium]|nr:sigma-70 family RNA polymerase sigma factor [Chloroflexota bacterium]
MQTGQPRPHPADETGHNGEANAVSPLTDNALLAAIQGHDDGALEQFYQRHGRVAFGLAYRILGERGVAEDVVQEAFLAVWRRAASFHPERGSGRGWLMSIVHNQAIDRHRGRHKRERTDVNIDAVSFHLESEADDPFVIVAEGMTAVEVRNALGALPDEQRHTIELAYFGGLTHQEIAERTGTPLGTVKSRMRLGLHKLRALLTDAVRPARGAGEPGTESRPVLP